MGHGELAERQQLRRSAFSDKIALEQQHTSRQGPFSTSKYTRELE
jgi:hypothetical protein